MVQFVKLRLSGFKSFVEPCELLIEPGITGIVGPNGCGKSNLVEALRWVMGETSAKRMRGSEMEDVIFGGTASRPARNLAEVVVTLDNRARRAPPAFNEQDVLEVTRRIERDRGSLYRINGREVRARDVQLLFADNATGAQSTAIVSQGRVGALINARPADRRHLLEEAAGISGLHSRRHEAELRLRAAESNLERLEDVLSTLESQLNQLRRQVRQATRYRNVAQALRQQEAVLLYLDLRAGREAERQAAAELKQSEARVSDLAAAAAEASHAAKEAQAALPPLREEDRETSAALQRLMMEREALLREAKQLEEARRRAEQRLQQLSGDLARSLALSRDAEEALARLQKEASALEEAMAGEAREREAAEERRDARAREVAELEEELNSLSQQLAANEARRKALTKRSRELSQAVARLEQRAAEVARERQRLKESGADREALPRARQALEVAKIKLETLREEVERREEALSALRQEAEALRAHLREREEAVTRLKAEQKAIASFLDRGKAAEHPPLLDYVSVQSGWEAALGAALGDDLEAPVDLPAALYWRTLEAYADNPPLPGGCRSLAELVQAPQALARRLAQVGIVEDDAVAERLQPLLRPGQSLVSRDGALWRWDGFIAAAGAPTAGAQRLEQRNRLAEVEKELQAALARHGEVAAAWDELQHRLKQASDAERQAREEQRLAFSHHSQSQSELARLEQRAAAEASRLAALEEQAENLERDRRETADLLAEVEAELQALAQSSQGEAEVNRGRAELAKRRRLLGEADAELRRLAAEAEARRERLEAIAREQRSWEKRLSEGAEHSRELQERRAAAEAEVRELARKPTEIETAQRRLAQSIETAEQRRVKAAELLAEAERRQALLEQQARDAEQQLAAAREERVRAEAKVAQAAQAMGALAERAREKFQVGIADLGQLAKLDDDQPFPDREEVRRQIERLQQERERIGPVNLRAEQEAEELADRLDSMIREREDLIAAIARLRQGIASLNREGRQRLLAAFEQVESRFSELFVRLFGGGRAHLKLTESEDPLAAGLEVMASPPGKKLQVLSLLSGGEQALTALALLFAVFLVNPAPICVLDEVDAPLDDSNVDRFCDLLEELARSISTRFLIVTHHRLTMARVDRLFGVTMVERGVSQLVSVDLEAATALRESA
mgnify:FL=1